MNNVEPQSAAGSAAVPEESKNELSMRLNIIERDKLVYTVSPINIKFDTIYSSFQQVVQIYLYEKQRE